MLHFRRIFSTPISFHGIDRIMIRYTYGYLRIISPNRMNFYFQGLMYKITLLWSDFPDRTHEVVSERDDPTWSQRLKFGSKSTVSLRETGTR